jgi:eukaryotic-like serine/threonine-protein kinase
VESRVADHSVIERLNTALEGRYRIEGELGEGGMATVYLADDLRHGRQVAVKVLRPALAAVVGADRFLAEIRMTAALQHPHILPLHDSGEAAGFLFYVMPFVKGESLRERLDRDRQLPVQEAVEIARKVADALEYAHEQDVIHRDIKPANILLNRGEPVVADFGIALALSEAGGGRITETGLSLGTPHYMSPEQATGERSLDPRSDVYALGCVLYEMLVGEPPFPGPTAQAVLARILTGDPRRVTATRRTVPEHVDGVVSKSLEKLPADRFDSAAEFAAALADPSFQYVPAAPAHRAATRDAGTRIGGDPAPGRLSGRRWPIAVAALVLILAAGLAAMAMTGGSPSATAAAGVLPAHRFLLAEPGTFSSDPQGGVAIGPDGTIAYVEGSGTSTRIMIRLPGELRPRLLQGTEGAVHPTFSPDGEWVLFSTEQELRKVPTRGGPVVALAQTETPPLIHPHWGPDGTIAMAKSDGLYRVPEVGGPLVKVYEAGAAFGARTPVILPNNGGWLFSESPSTSTSRLDLKLLDPATGEATMLVENAASPVWLATGHVAFVHPSGSLFAARYDLRRRQFATQPAPVMDSVRYAVFNRTFAASPAGAAVYMTGAGGLDLSAGAEIVLLGLDGEEDRILSVARTDHGDGQFSPDGERLAYTRDEQIWIFDMELGSHPRFTREGTNHHDPVWSPDGTRIAFTSERGSTGTDIWIKEVDGDAPATLFLEMEGLQYPKEWTESGLLVVQTSHAGSTDIYTAAVDGSADPRPYLRADWEEALPRVSPDGRWLAYTSDQRGESAIYVRSFPRPGPALLVSEPAISAANEPLWSPDGRTLYYHLIPSGDIVAAEVTADPDLQVASRQVVGQISGPIRDVHPSGRWILGFRFGADQADSSEIRLIGIVNWFSDLADRLGER